MLPIGLTLFSHHGGSQSWMAGLRREVEKARQPGAGLFSGVPACASGAMQPAARDACPQLSKPFRTVQTVQKLGCTCTPVPQRVVASRGRTAVLVLRLRSSTSFQQPLLLSSAVPEVQHGPAGGPEAGGGAEQHLLPAHGAWPRCRCAFKSGPNTQQIVASIQPGRSMSCHGHLLNQQLVFCHGLDPLRAAYVSCHASVGSALHFVLWDSEVGALHSQRRIQQRQRRR